MIIKRNKFVMCNISALKTACFVVSYCFLFFFNEAAYSQTIILKNNLIQRVLSYDGRIWRTTKFSNADGSITLPVKSEEFNILPMLGDDALSISDFRMIEKPRFYKKTDTSLLEIKYRPLARAMKNQACPRSVVITYFTVNGQYVTHKKIALLYGKAATVDRLEVERFVTKGDQSGGGRGEPVFVDDQWFMGLEYPAGYSRRTNGNLPENYGRYYDKVGNYSFIDLQGRDIEPKAEKGMIRLMHFPGYAVKNKYQFEINSKTSVVGFAGNGEPVKHAFMQYISSIWKQPRSFLNYNNWFDASAKDLKGDAFVNIYKAYKTAIAPYGITIDAMVPDDGWQNREGIWQPSTQYFPGGDEDLEILSQKLKKEGTHLGLWLSLNSYNNNIDWGLNAGYHEAGRNSYFKQYGWYYSLSATKYKQAILQRIPNLAKKADLVYFKHDFNDLCDTAKNNNHPPTDRHGHEASLDVALEILTSTRKARPEIFQNLTNWIWLSPWWLQYADSLWMLAGDDGINGNTPEISTKAMFTTDRDTYIWRLYGNANDRPLVPISRLMTHGILQTSPGDKKIPLQDWLDYVLMHYGRGTLLKEWYVSLDAMTTEQWKALCNVHKWAKTHEQELDNTVFVGGRPDEGNAYGYIGWHNAQGVLTARNTSALPQKLLIPFNESAGFYGAKNEDYKATIIYPYRDEYPLTFTSGKDIEIEMPGYATMVLQFEKGRPTGHTISNPGPISFVTTKDSSQYAKTVLTIPADVKDRCDLMLIGYPEVPVITINGAEIKPRLQTKALLNNFANYAISGMPSVKAVNWTMSAIDLLPYTGKNIEIVYRKKGKFETYILSERKVNVPNYAEAKNELWPINNDTRRQVFQLY